MNCPRCGRLAYPKIKQCTCGELLAWPAPIVTAPRPIHPVIARRLREIGFERRADEGLTEFAERCRRYTMERYSQNASRFKAENEREARTERAAIQGENAA